METVKLTLDTFWQQYAGTPFELIQGELAQMEPTGVEHGAVTRRVGAKLGDFVDANVLGEVVGGEVGFRLSEDTLRAADCAFISREKMDSLVEPAQYAPFAPDLAIEVVSPHDSAIDIQTKVTQYLAAGSRLVWVIYPSLQSVIDYHPDHTNITYTIDATLSGGDVLPGLALAVKDLFGPWKSTP